MNSLLLSGIALNEILLDLVIAAIIVLYFLWGIIKGFAKPLTGIISWGVAIAAIYFGGKLIGDIFLTQLGLEEVVRSVINVITESGITVSDPDLVVKYVGLIIASVIIILVVKIITFIINIFIKKARKPYKKTALDRSFGAILNTIKGAFVICLVLSVVVAIANIAIPEINDFINTSTVTKYIVQYNPVTMLFNKLVGA